ncbi:MAG: hypothetical protein IJT97_11285 [Bacteroidaceae bacterium]|nr:hypothetical protein [Bacteroidaceae bacterium]
MRKLEFETGRTLFRCDVPETWEELSVEQFMAITALDAGTIDGRTFYARYFGIRPEVVDRLDFYLLYVLNSLVEKVSAPQSGTVPNPFRGMRRFLVPSYRLGNGVVVVSPSECLSGMSFQQFMTVDTFYTWYVQTEERRFLVSMCCCLYLKEDEDFFSLNPAARQQLWEAADVAVLRSVLVQWSFIKRWLSGSYPFLFPAGERQDTKRGGKKVVSNAWLEIFDVLVQDDLTRIDSYKHLDCMDVVRILNRRLKNERMKTRK